MSSAGGYSTSLLCNVHEGLPNPETGETTLIKGDYEYWHYACDGFDDRGWGCGYRTLQTIASWIRANTGAEATVPSIPEIQKILVEIEDKEASFAGSRSWIGSFEYVDEDSPFCPALSELIKIVKIKQERNYKINLKKIPDFLDNMVCLVLDQRYDIRSKIIHVLRGKDLGEHTAKIKEHLAESGCPVMMGGDMDCSSKGIFGIHIGKENTYLLVVDPHFVGRAKSAKQLQGDCWVKWQNLNDFIDSSFYNLCLPQIGKPN